jgi:3-oxoadipate enol-lactonase
MTSMSRLLVLSLLIGSVGSAALPSAGRAAQAPTAGEATPAAEAPTPADTPPAPVTDTSTAPAEPPASPPGVPPLPPGDLGPLGRLAAQSRTALTAAGLERVETEAAGRRLVLWRGGSGPHLVLLHGSGHQAGAWAAVVPRLLAKYTVHALDLPGHGDSEPATGPLRVADVLAGVQGYVGSLDSPPILVGNSFGAWVATLVAHRRPESLSRVILVNGGALLNIPAPGLSLMPADREAARRVMTAIRDPGSPQLPDEVLDDVVRRAANGPIGRMFQDPGGLMEHLLDGRLHEVRVPVDVLWGTSDQLMPPDYARRMATQLPKVRLMWLEACGHIPAGECPDRFGNALRALLAAPAPDGPFPDPRAPKG